MPRRLSRETLYRRLVRQRKADETLARYKLTNPASTPCDGNHLGSFAHWAGDLYADVVVVIADFRSPERFIRDRCKPVLAADP